jgi:hypothetical protein
MEVPQGNFQWSYLKQAKMSFFFPLFFLYKIREQEGRIGPAWSFGTGGGRGSGEMVKK